MATFRKNQKDIDDISEAPHSPPPEDDDDADSVHSQTS